MANENMKMSGDGMVDLRRREHAVFRYYNDAANNCTFGVGALVHYGRCTSTELKKRVTTKQVNRQLATRVRMAEATVNRHVKHHLTQAQFDSLVSFVYNVGPTGAKSTLDAANRGAFREVITHMNKNVYVHPRDAHGRRMPPIRLQGLVNRRRQEVLPFQQGQTH